MPAPNSARMAEKPPISDLRNWSIFAPISIILSEGATTCMWQGLMARVPLVQ